MSHVSTVIIISPYMRFPDKVNEAVTRLHHGDYYEEGERFPVVEATSENQGFFGGGKWPGGSLIWIGWNYFHIDELLEVLKPFENLTVWYETEGEYMSIERINWNMNNGAR